MGKASRRQRGTDTASGQSRAKPAPFERRPFQGLAGETDWVALREILPAATAVVTVRPEHVPDGVTSEVTVATVLPLAWPGLHRADGTVLIGTQSGNASGDASRDLPEQLVDEAEMVASELLTNAVRHARPLSDGTIRVRWKIRGDVVEVEVTDGGGESVPRPAPRTVWLSSGRGLRIVRSIAHEWGVTEDRTGNVVWATLGGPSRRRAT